jgi:hypothetical protein
MYGHQYTRAQIRFIERKIAGRSVAEVTALFNRRFSLSLTEGQIRGFMSRHHLCNGRDGRFKPGNVSYNKGVKGLHYSPATEFKKGSRPWNYQPVGSKRINGLGYTEVKIADPNKWKKKHVLVWEKANGKVPKGSVVIFADGDKTNFKLKNLLLVSRRELSVMNKCGLIYGHSGLTKTGKLIADVKLLIGDRKRAALKRKRKRGGRK